MVYPACRSLQLVFHKALLVQIFLPGRYSSEWQLQGEKRHKEKGAFPMKKNQEKGREEFISAVLVAVTLLLIIIYLLQLITA